MPTDVGLPKEGMIYQREQYAKGGIGKKYWLYKDERIMERAAGAGTVVDIGCGEGILLERLAAAYPEKRVLGIDAEKENVDICTRLGLDVSYGSVYELPLNDSSADCVVFSEVIEHLDSPEKAISEINRVLRPGARLILLFPNDRMFKMSRILTLMIKEAFYDTGHVKQWRPSSIRELLKDAGLVVTEQTSIPFRFWPISLHHLVVAHKPSCT